MLAYLEQIIAARSVESVWRHHTAKMAEYGFDRLIYGLTRFHSGRSLGDRNDILILTNHSKAYAEPFINDRMYFDAPMVRWAVDNAGACSWRRVVEQAGALTPEEQRVVAFNLTHGVTAGYTVSFHSSHSNTRAAIALTGKPGLSQDAVDDIWAEHGRALEVMNNVAHLKLAALPYANTARKLTDRQREVLEWVGSGKTMQDTAVLMGLTPATVEKHLRLARGVLDVDTTAHAVMKASIQNQIFVLSA